MVRTKLGSLSEPESLRGLVRNLREGIYITSSSGEILDANPAFLEMFGIASLHELPELRTNDFLVDPGTRKREIEILEKDGVVRDFELEIRNRQGEVRTMIDTAFRIRDEETGEVLYQGILVDITERKRLERALVEQSIRDPLTGCYNRRFLAGLALRLEAKPDPWGCLVLDIDHFKTYNDRHGHEAGDAVLVKVSRFLMRQSRAQEAVVRMGGDEFLVVLAGAEEAGALTAAERLKVRAAREKLVPFSLGFASRRGDEKLEKTISRADLHLLASREAQRGPSAPVQGTA